MNTTPLFFQRCTAAALALLLLTAPSTLRAQSLSDLNKIIWGQLYGVSAAQYSDPAYLAADADGDGVTNGDELAAGTNPNDSSSVLKILSAVQSGSNVQITFPTVSGKFYEVLFQTADGQGVLGPWQSFNPKATAAGTNGNVTVTVPSSTNTFYRVAVSDIDTDGDGITDWAEIFLGLDPTQVSSSGQLDAFGKPLTDTAYAQSNLANANSVTISAAGGNASVQQQDSGAASAFGDFTLTRGGLPALLGSLTVTVSVGGTAVGGTDYVAIPSTVTFAAGARTADVKVTPLANAARVSSVSVIMTVQPGSGYTVGAANSAAVAIFPAGTTANGTGLTGTYYSGSGTPHSSAANFSTSYLPAKTRLDSTVDFTWTTAATLPAGVASSSFCVRWTGQILPQYSETYTFDVKGRDGCFLKIGGQTVIDSWHSYGAAVDQTGTITLQAGVRYDIQLDYFCGSGVNATSQCHLEWYSPSQVLQVVPMGRLFPSGIGAPITPPTITSSLVAYAYINKPFTFDVTTNSHSTSTNITLASGTLPAGLTFNQVMTKDPNHLNDPNYTGQMVGRISGTPTVAGDYQLSFKATNAAGSASSVLDLQVLDTGNGITYEVWTGVSSALTTSDIPTSTTPNLTGVVNTFEDNATTYGNNYGERIRGYLTVTTTGNYYFWISANDVAELYIGNDPTAAAKVKRAATTGSATARQWSAHLTQKSGWINLTAGVKYYIEVLHKGLSGTANHLAIGYTLDPTGNGAPLADGTGVIPGFMLWQYFNPASSLASQAVSAGTLYVAALAPADGNTTATGIATLLMNAAQTQAVVKFSYQGLSSGIANLRIENDQYLTHQLSEVFDISVAKPQSDGSYIWTFKPTGTFTSVSDLVAMIRQGKAALVIQTANYPAGELRGNFTIANGSQSFTAPAAPSYTLPTTGISEADAARFLQQATFGPTPSDLAAVQSMGYLAWVNNQLTLPSSHLVDYAFDVGDANNRYPETQTYNAWWRRSITAPDQLRQRVAYALSEIFVTSAVGSLSNNSRALSSYYDTLLDSAFVRYQDLLKAVTLHPAMGAYLNMLSNRNGDLTVGRIPNENYAREIMQLFSIGLNRLWPDGSLMLDANFQPIPTYDQSIVSGSARVFTGWYYAQPMTGNGRLPRNFGSYNDLTGWLQPMSLFPCDSSGRDLHELGSKKILNNEVLPPAINTNSSSPTLDSNATLADGTTNPYFGYNLYDENGLRDLDNVLASIANHPNVGPFFCRQLIQRLVTSNPSPGYVYRVTQAFNGERTWDGQVTGVRGSLADTVKAILFDYEARSSDMLTNSAFGKQREPVMRVTVPARYFLSAPVTGTFTQSSTDSTTVHPSQFRVDLTGNILLAAGDSVNLTPTSVTPGTAPQPLTGTYVVRSVLFDSSRGGASPRTNPSIFVDATGVLGGTYTQSGTTITVTDSNGSAHNLIAGEPVYLNFFGTNAPTAGPYTVATVTSTTVFTVTAASSNTIGTAQVCLMNRLPGCSYIPSFNSTTGVLTTTISTPVPHQLTVGQQVYFTDNQGTGSNSGGPYTITSIPTLADGSPNPKQFVATITLTPTDTSHNHTTAISGIELFPQVPPVLDRTGNLTFYDSNWGMGQTDAESTTASLTQTPMRSQTVFNFFYPSFSYPGDLSLDGITTPEFQLTSDTNIILLSNFLEQGIQNSGLTDGRTSFRAANGSIVLDMSTLGTAANTSNSNLGAAIVDKLNTDLMGGTMSTSMRNSIVTYVTTQANLPYTTPTAQQVSDRIRAVVQLIISSTEFAIQR